MKMDLSNRARTRLRLLIQDDTAGHGFLIGQRIGRHHVVDDLFLIGNQSMEAFALRFTRYLDAFHETLLGILFVNAPLQMDPVYLESLVIHIHDGSYEVYWYGANGSSGAGELVSVPAVKV